MLRPITIASLLSILVLSSCGEDISNMPKESRGDEPDVVESVEAGLEEPPLFVNSDGNNPPMAFFTLDRYRYSSGSTVTFDGSSSVDRDSDITTYIWKSDLDGEIGREESFSTDSLTVGEHKVTLTVYDSLRNSGSFYKMIEVYEPIEIIESNNQSGSFVRPSLLSKNGDNSLQDIVTGLIWSDTDGVSGTFSDAELYCSQLELDGISDWRVPTIKELWYISDTVDNPLWRSMKPLKYWSSTAVNIFGETDNNLIVDFETLDQKWAVRDYRYSTVNVRCVSGDFGFRPEFERDSSEGVVADRRNYLQWQDTNGMESRHSDEAEGYCNGLVLSGYTNWRLPTARELYSILLYSSEYDPLTYNYFHNGDSGFYFTSSERNDGSIIAIDFSTGKSGIVEFGAVRCVRGL